MYYNSSSWKTAWQLAVINYWKNVYFLVRTQWDLKILNKSACLEKLAVARQLIATVILCMQVLHNWPPRTICIAAANSKTVTESYFAKCDYQSPTLTLLKSSLRLCIVVSIYCNKYNLIFQTLKFKKFVITARLKFIQDLHSFSTVHQHKISSFSAIK